MINLFSNLKAHQVWVGAFFFLNIYNLNTFVDSAADSEGLVGRLGLERLHVPAGLCSDICQAGLVPWQGGRAGSWGLSPGQAQGLGAFTKPRKGFSRFNPRFTLVCPLLLRTPTCPGYLSFKN